MVLLCHAWGGRDEFICQKAIAIADLGFVGFAIDMYGQGIGGKSKEENQALKKPFIADRSLLKRRLLTGFEAACALPNVDADRVIVLGFGFGGLCALDLARSGVNLLGAICVYGHFDAPTYDDVKAIHAKILLLHGHDDPVAPLSELLCFQKQLELEKVDWHCVIYGSTVHAFASPSANEPLLGIAHNPLSAKRAWATIEQFLREVFFE